MDFRLFRRERPMPATGETLFTMFATTGPLGAPSDGPGEGGGSVLGFA